MVTVRTLGWLIFTLHVGSLFALPDVNVSAQVQWENIYENQPIDGSVSVTYSKDKKMDPTSFKIGGKPLKVVLYKEVQISDTPPLLVTTYNFQLPGMEKGLQLLPAVSVQVGGKTYQSTPSTFQVHEGGPKTGPILKLENVYEGLTPLYPGQRAQVGYRYLYNTNIELTEEYLPLLDAANFRKIGDKSINNAESGNMTATLITQVVEAVTEGSYTFGPSLIAGNAYVMDARGKRTYLTPKLVAEAPALEIDVAGFPNDGKPASFNGAVGQFNFQVKMLTPSQVHMGDKIEIQMVISGNGQLENILPPDLCCQIGYSGVFKTSDLPPVGKISGNAKTFVVSVYPLTTEIDTLPPIEFSFFDPLKRKYVSLISQGTPLTVLPAPVVKKNNPNKEIALAADMQERVTPIEINSNYSLQSLDLRNRPFGGLWVLALAPLGFLLLFFQAALKNDLERKHLLALPVRSKRLFQEAADSVSDEKRFYTLLERSFLALLAEKKLIGEPVAQIEKLPLDRPLALKVRQFFQDLDHRRFSGNGSVTTKDVLAKAKSLFMEISKG